MSSHYDTLLKQLRDASEHQPPAPAFDAVDIAAGTRSFRKSMKDTARGLGKIKAPAAPKGPPVPSPAEVMSKALGAFRAGKITGSINAKPLTRSVRWPAVSKLTVAPIE